MTDPDIAAEFTTFIALPITDRQRSHDFYIEVLGTDPIGPAGADGLPEPLRFDLDGTSIVLVPAGGLDWAIGDRNLAPPDTIGCIITIGASSDDEVDDICQRAEQAGATLIVAPTRQPWGMYAGTFADPDGNTWMATSTPLADG